MNHIMVDIETLGSNSNALILSIGAVRFNLATGETGETFHFKIQPDSCIRAGLQINPSTVIWWMQQNETARIRLKDIDTVGWSLSEVLSFFRDFILKNPDSFIWGNSARFDLGILNDAYIAIGEQRPWDFRKELDVRTLLFCNPEAKIKTKRDGVEHDALDDCYHQIKMCSYAYSSIKISADD